MDADLLCAPIGKRRSHSSRYARLALLCLLPALFAGCSPKDQPGKYQVMAKVNGREVTVPEVNQYLDQMKSYQGSKKQIRRNAVNAVIDQHLLIDAAKQAGLDKTPVVMQQLLLSQKQALIKAYLDERTKSLPLPDSAQIGAYYQSHPLLFADRTLYVVEHYDIEADLAQQKKLLAQLQSSNSSTQFFDELSHSNIQYDQWRTVKIPEDTSSAELSILAKMSLDGALVVDQTRKGMELLVLESKIAAPISLNHAQLKITRLLMEEEKTWATEALLQNLRAHAQIQYLDQ
ncbi:MAG: EpsD family peptidyl-prolyl cis-trans isomerase [Burkholderiales bacterium]